jgi:hypothetical protein
MVWLAIVAALIVPAVVEPTALAATPEISVEIYPPVTAPGGRFPVHWDISGGTTVNETYLLWDTTSHEHRQDYAFSTEAQSGGMDRYETHILVPEDADAIYFMPYAEIDGTEYYGEREYTVPSTYALNVGGDAFGLDAEGQYWNPDREIDVSETWYEFTDGERATTETPIAGTAEDWIYQSQRVGMSELALWMSPDVYQIDLEVGFYFAEFESDAAGQRVFDIYLERGTPNEQVLRDIDVFDLAGGAHAATAISTTVTVTSIPDVDEHLDIVFDSPGGDAPILNGLVLRGLSAVPQYHVQRAVGTGAGDTYTDASGTHTDANEVWLGGNEQYHGGFRFNTLRMPQSAVINYADLTVTAASDASMDTVLAIYGHDHDSSPSFAYSAIVPNRPRTDASVPWNPSDTFWRAGSAYQSPELAPIVQEIVNRPGWRQGNALSLLLIAGPGDVGSARKVWSYEGSFPDRAMLSVHYSLAEDVPTPTPTVEPTATPQPTATLEPSPTPVARIWLPLVMR